MKRLLIAVFTLFATVSVAVAGDVKNGNAYLKPVAEDRFHIGGSPMGKQMLLGYLQDLKDSEHITGVVMRQAGKATDQHRHLLKVIADHLEIQAFVEDGGELSPLGE
jgi:hypothetical protein